MQHGDMETLMHATAGIDTGPKEKNWCEKRPKKCHLYLHSYPLLRPELELKIVPTGKSGTELIVVHLPRSVRSSVELAGLVLHLAALGTWHHRERPGEDCRPKFGSIPLSAGG